MKPDQISELPSFLTDPRTKPERFLSRMPACPSHRGKGGDHIKLTPDKAAQICSRVARGQSLFRAVKGAGLSWATITRNMRLAGDTGFFGVYEKEKRVYFEVFLELVQEAEALARELADDWIVSQLKVAVTRKRKVVTRTHRVVATGDDGEPVETLDEITTEELTDSEWSPKDKLEWLDRLLAAVYNPSVTPIIHREEVYPGAPEIAFVETEAGVRIEHGTEVLKRDKGSARREKRS